MIFCVVVPYFTSVIVRTYSWMVLLGRNGVVNQLLQAPGLIERRCTLLYNKVGIVIGMTYVLLPYMVLTLFAAMKAIDPSLLRAARGLGASRLYVFRRVYLPLSLHGVVSGALIVFILAIGFFITPALMGGPADVMVAMLIERSVEITIDWPSAAVMSLLLLAATLVLYAVYYRVTDVRRHAGRHERCRRAGPPRPLALCRHRLPAADAADRHRADAGVQRRQPICSSRPTAFRCAGSRASSAMRAGRPRCGRAW